MIKTQRAKCRVCDEVRRCVECPGFGWICTFCKRLERVTATRTVSAHPRTMPLK